MIDIKRLESDREYFEQYRESLANRGDQPEKLDVLLRENLVRRNLIAETEALRAQQNAVSKEIANKKRSAEDTEELQSNMQVLSRDIKDKLKIIDEIQLKLESLWLDLPNICDATVPIGAGEADNVVVKVWGDQRKFGFPVKDHHDLGEKSGQIDFERAAKVSSARFAFLRGDLARLEMALIQWMLDQHINQHGYELVLPPYLINAQSLVGTGQLPKFKNDLFHVAGVDLVLAPTAEVPVTNFFQGEILTDVDLPKHFVAYSPCFRAEAGSHGRDTRGLIRQHQFHKVEMVKFTRPEDSVAEHESMVNHAEALLQALELPYRVISLCTKDIGFSAAKCYDIEVWLPSAEAYREISSCSNCLDFQARRANIRFRPTPGAKPQYVHTLNGSGLAVGRTLIAIMENYQTESGEIQVPGVLEPYLGGKKILLNS